MESKIIYLLCQITSLASQDLSLINLNMFIPAMIGTLFVIGILIGSLGSLISMNRYLKI